MSLPSLPDIENSPSSPDSPLSTAFNILFEHSPILTSKLEPQLHAIFESSPESLTSYAQLIDLALSEIAAWDRTSQADFISGHPRIGERKNLSKLSASEQGAAGETNGLNGESEVNSPPPEVLARLEHLNVLYEVKYPGLRYITFVNGRSREVIAREMEEALGIEHSLETDKPGQDTIVAIERGSVVWKRELQRAVSDVGKIAKSRLRALGVS